MKTELTAELCADVAEALSLPHPGLVEKDFHVVRALSALKNVEHAGAHLAFGGGTSLCRAYRLIERMSEDIDLRIVSDKPLTDGGRRKFRAAVTESLHAAGFEFDPKNPKHMDAHDGGKTFVYNLPYVQVAQSVGSLRPGVKIEVSSWPLQMDTVPRAVYSFVAQAQDAAAEVAEIQCVDVAETAADKFVALTRRVAEERHLGDERDRSLLRHVYDLYRIRPHIKLDKVKPMIGSIMESDRKTRSRKFPAYANNPQAVSRSSIQALTDDGSYAEEFDVFQRDMVYGERVSLANCLPVLQEFAALL